ncbi:MAG TPA: hypothetical protein VJI97_04495 [Candidatus Nanoarchaeia archaeon]|nr:hypothetical protein [Candidatus Nanoarchaeia archaeon]
MEWLKRYTFFNLALLATGIAAGVILSNMIAGKAAGAQGIVPSLILNFGTMGVHVHHWIWATALFVAILKINKLNTIVKKSGYSNILIGITLGIALHGIAWYDDWYNILLH